MTVLRHRLLDDSGHPVTGRRASIHKASDAGPPGGYQRMRTLRATSDDNGWLTWQLPTPPEPTVYVVSGVENTPVGVLIPPRVSTTTVVATRVGPVLGDTDPASWPPELVTKGELIERLGTVVAELAELTPDTDAEREVYVPQRLTDAALLRRFWTVAAVADFGATGDGITDDTAAINAALSACPEGGQVFFRPGTYLITAPILLTRNKALVGSHAGVWPYDTGGPCRIKAASTFTGDALIRMKDEEDLTGAVGAPASGLYVGPNDQSGMGIHRLTLDGFNVAGSIDGVKASGLVRSIRISEVSIRRCTGSAVHTVGYTRTGGATVYPRGWRLEQVTADSSGNMGYALNLLNDSTLIDCLAVGNASHGFYLAGPGETVLVGCRAAWNKARGFYLTGTCYGNVVLSACTTDRNEQSGVFIDCSGRHPIKLDVALRRDGRNGGSGGGNYAGLLVSGATTPVVVSGITTETGQDDDATGVMSPQFGLRVLNATAVVVDSGVLGGQQAAVLDGGGNTNLRISPRVLLMTGSINSPTLVFQPDTGPFPTPAEHGMAAWSFDPAVINTSSVLTSGVLTLVKLRTTAPLTPATAWLHVATAGAGLTAGQCLVGLYNAAGALLAATADQAVAWTTAGAKGMALAVVAGQSITALPPGVYYLGILAVGTTPPALARGSGVGANNINLAAGGYRHGSYGTGLTALPVALTMGSMTGSGIAWWAGLA